MWEKEYYTTVSKYNPTVNKNQKKEAIHKEGSGKFAPRSYMSLLMVVGFQVLFTFFLVLV